MVLPLFLFLQFGFSQLKFYVLIVVLCVYRFFMRTNLDVLGYLVLQDSMQLFLVYLTPTQCFSLNPLDLAEPFFVELLFVLDGFRWLLLGHVAR